MLCCNFNKIFFQAKCTENQHHKHKSNISRRNKIALEQARNLNYSRAMCILRSPGFATDPPTTIVNQLHDLHPPESVGMTARMYTNCWWFYSLIPNVWKSKSDEASAAQQWIDGAGITRKCAGHYQWNCLNRAFDLSRLRMPGNES